MSDQNKPQDPNGHSKERGLKNPSRRRFLIHTGYAIGGAVVGGVIGNLLPSMRRRSLTAPTAPNENHFNEALMFFNQEQFGIVSAAVERIYPADENGPGAKELGVPFYIDHQLASDWGFNARDYMEYPFYVGEKVQGYQGRLKRREIFSIGLREMQNYSNSKYNKNFTELTGEQQDEVLKAFQTDAVKLTTISASGFFAMLRSSTLEGVYSDPLYGGNKNMGGWIMRNYPGNQMSYAQVIEKDFTKIPPSSLKDHLTHS